MASGAGPRTTDALAGRGRLWLATARAQWSAWTVRGARPTTSGDSELPSWRRSLSDRARAGTLPGILATIRADRGACSRAQTQIFTPSRSTTLESRLPARSRARTMKWKVVSERSGGVEKVVAPRFEVYVGNEKSSPPALVA
jgi:hypothetical protein